MTCRANNRQLTRKRLALERERDRIFEQIRSYPPPIPACDDQFNYLLAERDRIARELVRTRQIERDRDEA